MPYRWLTLVRSAGDRLATNEWFVFAPVVYSIQLAVEVVYRVQYGFTHLYRVDFLAFYTGAQLLVTNPTQLYSPVAQFGIENPISSQLPKVLLFVNPPAAVLPLVPLTGLPFTAALAIFYAVSGLALIIAGILLERLLPRSLPGYKRILLTVAAVGYAGVENFGVGQWDSLQLLAIVIAAWAIRGGKPLVGGLVLSLVLVKPQLGLFILPALLLGRHSRAAVGFLVGGVAWFLSTLLLVGVDGIRSYLSVLTLDYNTQVFASDSISSLTELLLGRGAPAAASVLLTIGMLALLYRLRERLGNTDVAIALALAVSFVSATVIHRWDTELLAFPVILVTAWNPGVGLIAALALGLGALVPHTSGILVALGIATALCFLWKPDATKMGI